MATFFGEDVFAGEFSISESSSNRSELSAEQSEGDWIRNCGRLGVTGDCFTYFKLNADIIIETSQTKCLRNLHNVWQMKRPISLG